MKDLVTSSQQNNQVTMTTVLRLELVVEHYTQWKLSKLGGEKGNFIPK
jgi:hypothetical protein